MNALPATFYKIKALLLTSFVFATFVIYFTAQPLAALNDDVVPLVDNRKGFVHQILIYFNVLLITYFRSIWLILTDLTQLAKTSKLRLNEEEPCLNVLKPGQQTPQCSTGLKGR